MAFSPQTQYLFSQYGHGTGVGGAPDDPRHRGPRPPRFARQPDQTNQPPNPVMYAQNSPLSGMGFGGDPTPQVLPEARPQPMGPKQATLGAPATMKHPILRPNYFDDQQQEG